LRKRGFKLKNKNIAANPFGKPLSLYFSPIPQNDHGREERERGRGGGTRRERKRMREEERQCHLHIFF
jgi:hypothetical protein